MTTTKNTNHLISFSTFVFLIVSLLPVAVAKNAASPSAIQHIVFTRWRKAPRGWQKFDTANFTSLDSLKWIRSEANVTRNFNFILLTSSAQYILAAPFPGSFVVRFGIYEKTRCAKRRAIQFTVNDVSPPPLNAAKQCGCGVPYFFDIPFLVADDLLIKIEWTRVPGSWKPALSNFEIFTEDNAPPVFSCPGSSPSAPPTVLTTPSISASASVPVTASQSTPPKASSTSSPAASELTFPSASASTSASASVSISSALSESPTASPAPSSSASSVASTASPSSSSTISIEDVNVNINAGSDLSGSVNGSVPYVTDDMLNLTSNLHNIPASSFSSIVQGGEFKYFFNLPPGTYNVIIGFIELFEENCVPGARVFNVLINGNMRLESYDIFASAESCKTAIVEQFYKQNIDALEPHPLSITFVGIAGLAAVAHISIRPSRQQCTPAITSDVSVTDDHLAHAVPGEYPPNGEPSYVDRQGRGYVWVTIDGSASHTHFSSGSVIGKVKSFSWSIAETGQVIANKRNFVRRFPLGTTRLRLRVVDDACTSDEAETTVTVTGRMQPGAYCYYYNGITDLPFAGTLNEFPRPVFASVANSLGSLSLPQFSFSSTAFVMRCVFFAEFSAQSEATDVKVIVGNSGLARLYRGNDLILDSNTSTNGTTSTTVGLQQFELLYHRANSDAIPTVQLLFNDTAPTITHDQSTVLPVLKSINPSSGRPGGGGQVTLTGYGLFTPLTVTIGGKNITTTPKVGNRLSRRIVPPAGTGIVEVNVTSASGFTSNSMIYSYGSTCDPVDFEPTDISMPDGSPVELDSPTSIATWQDGKLYVGCRTGVVRVITYDHVSLTVMDMCHSQTLQDDRYEDFRSNPSERAILGINFDPRDSEPRPYISTSSIFWERRANIRRKNPISWSNGAIVRLKPSKPETLASDPKQCLEFDRTIVENLPVSNIDHAVNELVFTQNGDLLITVGGNTNAGLPAFRGGGIWEAYFSASVVIAKLSDPSFNGTIQYSTPENLRTARPLTEDVSIYAYGIRNLFSMAMTRSGHIYGADMGPNCKSGNASISCDEYDESDAVLRSPSDRESFYPGKVIVGDKDECKYGPRRRDKLVLIQEGKYYGHPNIQRAVLTGKLDECAWIDPETHKTGRPFQSPPPSNYARQLTLVGSATTGLREYGSNLFCGALRSDLILNLFKGRGVSHVTLSNDTSTVKVTSKEGFDGSRGGLRVEENVHGDLIFPRYTIPENGRGGFYVMRPVVSSRIGVQAVNALPFRHGQAGGTTVIVGGWGFQNGASVFVGDYPCPISSLTETQISCTVPPYGGGSLSVDIIVSAAGLTSTLDKAILYMNV